MASTHIGADDFGSSSSNANIGILTCLFSKSKLNFRPGVFMDSTLSPAGFRQCRSKFCLQAVLCVHPVLAYSTRANVLLMMSS